MWQVLSIAPGGAYIDQMFANPYPVEFDSRRPFPVSLWCPLSRKPLQDAMNEGLESLHLEFLKCHSGGPPSILSLQDAKGGGFNPGHGKQNSGIGMSRTWGNEYEKQRPYSSTVSRLIAYFLVCGFGVWFCFI